MDTCIHLGTDTGDECAWFSIYKRYKDETEEEIEQLKEDIEKARNQVDFQQEVYREHIDEIDSLKAARDALKTALLGMVDQFGFHRVHTGMVHDERQAILNALEAIDAARWIALRKDARPPPIGRQRAAAVSRTIRRRADTAIGPQAAHRA